MAGKRANGEDSIYAYRGRWYVQGYIQGKRRKVSSKTQQEARKKWADLKAKAARGTLDTSGQMTLEALLEEWFLGHKIRLRYKTPVGYRTSIDRHLVPQLGKKKINAVTVAHVEAWQNHLLASGLSSSTVRQARVVLHMALDSAVRHGTLAANPVDRAQSLPKPRSRIQALTLDEARRVLAVVDAPSDYARVLLALSLGLRQGELLGLTWDRIDLEADQPRLSVQSRLQRQTGRGLVPVEPKTEKSRRTIYLAPEHVAALRAVRSAQQARRLALGGDFDPGGYVFTTDRGTPIDSANDLKRWYRWPEEAGVRRLTGHAARHTAATLMLADNQSIAIVQQVLGHDDSRTTVNFYGHLTSDHSAGAVAAVTARLTA